MAFFESAKAFADTMSELHGSDHGGRLETFIFVWMVVKRFTRPISSAVQKLVTAHEVNSEKLGEHAKVLEVHGVTLQNHEHRIVVLEIDKQKGE